MRAKFAREVAAAGLATRGGPSAQTIVGDEDLAALPLAAQRYLRFMGVLGRPRDWCFRAHMTGRFRTKPDQSWLAMEAWQHDSRPGRAVWHLPKGDFTYVEMTFAPGDVVFNVPPGQ